MPITLAVHVLCFALVATGVIANDVVHVTVRRAVGRGASADAASIARMMPRFALLSQIGAVLMLLTGIGLLAERHWADWGQGWLTAKLIVFGVLILNGPLVARPAALALIDALAGGKAEATEPLLHRLSLFHVVQTIGLATIVVLAVLRPF